MKQLRLQICTWNVGGSEPLKENDILKLLKLENPADIYAVSLQEIETGVVETAKSFISYDDWTISFISTLSKHGYYLVESVRVQGISLSVFAKIQHLPFIRFIKTDIERTGLAGNWGNKGGVGVSAIFYGKKLCFVTAHLAAHLHKNDERIDDFVEIINSMEFDGTTTILSHDVVFWSGDLNFRIDEYSREEILQMIEQKDYEKILKQDQLKKLLQHNDVVSEFTEGCITFPPTYKFDPGSDVYDTSGKQRKPAWTDRILYRLNPDTNYLAKAMHSVVQASLTSIVSTTSPLRDPIEQVEESYQSHAEFKSSDHKPVSTQYILNVLKDQDPLVVLNVEGIWKNTCEGSVTINYHNGMKSESRDYLALYEEFYGDFRSYKTWMYIPEINDETSQKSQICKFPVETSDEKSKWRIGYYSDRMSCTLAITEPFTID